MLLCCISGNEEEYRKTESLRAVVGHLIATACDFIRLGAFAALVLPSAPFYVAMTDWADIRIL